MLITARQEQIQHKDHFLAVQAQRDREEFERVLRSVGEKHTPYIIIAQSMHVSVLK